MKKSEFPAVEVLNPTNQPGMLFVCDHASNNIPPEFGTLGLGAELLETHIAYDIGAAALTRSLAQALNAPAVLGTASRLLVDLNRGRDDPTLVMKLSDGSIIPGNAKLSPEEYQSRLIRFYEPYHNKIEDEIRRAKDLSLTPVIISVHSFTPAWKSVQRPWQVGILWSKHDRRLSDILLALLREEPGLVVGDNQPYSGELEGDCMAQHAIAHGLPHALIEVRQDLITTQSQVETWSKRLAPLITKAVKRLKATGDTR